MHMVLPYHHVPQGSPGYNVSKKIYGYVNPFSTPTLSDTTRSKDLDCFGATLSLQPLVTSCILFISLLRSYIYES